MQYLWYIRKLFNDGFISAPERDRLKEMIFDDDKRLLELLEDSKMIKHRLRFSNLHEKDNAKPLKIPHKPVMREAKFLSQKEVKDLTEEPLSGSTADSPIDSEVSTSLGGIDHTGPNRKVLSKLKARTDFTCLNTADDVHVTFRPKKKLTRVETFGPSMINTD